MCTLRRKYSAIWLLGALSSINCVSAKVIDGNRSDLTTDPHRISLYCLGNNITNEINRRQTRQSKPVGINVGLGGGASQYELISAARRTYLHGFGEDPCAAMLRNVTMAYRTSPASVLMNAL